MIFRRLTLQNFRQFYGCHTIEFAGTGKANVTVIHGANGAGKTTLLNAFTWLLYEATSPDFEDAERLECERTFAELQAGSDLEVMVELTFEDRGLTYMIKRSMLITKDSEGARRPRPTVLIVRFAEEFGEFREPSNPQNFIEHLLPPALYPFFFFNGERIERLAGEGAWKEVESGLKVLLDLELFDRAISHLEGDTSRRLRDEITNHSGNEGLQVKQERNGLEAQLAKRQSELDQYQVNLVAYLEEREAIDAKLSAMPELARHQAERKAVEADVVRVKQELIEAKQEIARQVSRDGYLILARPVLASAQELLEQAHQAGQLPIKIKRQFVDELLESGVCICKRDLIKESPPYESVLAWRNLAASEALEAAVTVTKSEIPALLERRERSLKEVDRLQEKREVLRRELRTLGERADELSTLIKKNEHGEDQGKLEDRRTKLDEDSNKVRIEIKLAQSAIADIQEQLKAVDQKLKNIAKVDEAAKLAESRLQSVTNVASALRKIRELRHDDLRNDLSERVGAIWSRISVKDYRAELDADYHLRLTKPVGSSMEPVRGASTGEKQILSLAFIGSLADKARETYEHHGAQEGALFLGGLYPIVMDSAFGNLESEYRREVASGIPSLAPQVIILVSETQWRNEVEQELDARIGRQYILRLATQKKKGRPIRLRNRDYEYILETSDMFDSTNVMEVTQ
ncbi:AAA family ATPase [Acidicapsa dinghuensis]|uniref:AAA family ATPase n=1 Tax=Acidicapsa dinghuensis TaxID=2218256 RepID=A0ABW1EM74_9BACT|nr:AAA family ATPase [Acidicapsa dinghuensis]